MAALLVSLGVMAVLMAAALPVWRHEMQREKEAELIFRGESYAKALGRFQRKAGPGVLPTSIEALVDQKFLRKKYKDPMTEDGEFQLLYVGSSSPSPGSSPGRGTPAPGSGSAPGRNPISPGAATPPGRGPVAPGTSPGGATGAGINGVVSKSKETSIRVYKDDPLQRVDLPRTEPGQCPGWRPDAAAPVVVRQAVGRVEPVPAGTRPRARRPGGPGRDSLPAVRHPAPPGAAAAVSRLTEG